MPPRKSITLLGATLLAAMICLPTIAVADQPLPAPSPDAVKIEATKVETDRIEATKVEATAIDTDGNRILWEQPLQQSHKPCVGCATVNVPQVSYQPQVTYRQVQVPPIQAKPVYAVPVCGPRGCGVAAPLVTIPTTYRAKRGLFGHIRLVPVRW